MAGFIIYNGILEKYQDNDSDISDISDITIPDSVTEIDSSAFSGCPGMTMHANKGSYAKRYAKEHNIKFKTL